MVLQPDGKILIGGFTNGAASQLTAIRVNPDGSLDTTFDGDGRLVFTQPGTTYVYALAVQSDGKIVAAGYTSNNGNVMIGVARLKPDGSPDTSFDGDGFVSTAIGNSDGDPLTLRSQRAAGFERWAMGIWGEVGSFWRGVQLASHFVQLANRILKYNNHG